MGNLGRLIVPYISLQSKVGFVDGKGNLWLNAPVTSVVACDDSWYGAPLASVM